jgi:predicted PurR-regulated permease PerM
MNLQSHPFYQKLSFVLLMLGLLCGLIVVAQDIIIPLCFAFLLSVLLLPAVNYLVRKKINRVVAILLVLLFSFIVIAGLLYFISTQVINFTDDIPTIKKQLNLHYNTLQSWIKEQFSITLRQQDKLLDKASEEIKNSGTGVIGITFFSVTKILVVLFLLPVYTFLVLYYKDMLKKFIVDVFATRHELKVREVLKEARSIVQSYMAGLLIEMGIVASINITGFLILGIRYPVFLGLLAAILNLIPYIGMLIATFFCMLITLTTSQQISDVLWVGIILVIVQFIDNNFIMLKVVSSKVKVNALISILGVLIGGALAGVSGMFLSIPAIAVLKAIFERVDELKPWGMLLGDEITGTHSNQFVTKIIKFRKQQPKANNEP